MNLGPSFLTRREALILASGTLAVATLKPKAEAAPLRAYPHPRMGPRHHAHDLLLAG